MRTSIICPIILAALWCFALPYQAKADVITYDSLRYDSSTGFVYGYASTALTYPDQYYYDAGVSSVLADQYYAVLDQGSALGGSFESVNTQTFGQPATTYDLQSSHYVGFYFYYCDYECYYYDYYGYSLYGGEYPEYDDFKPIRFCYVGYDIADIADTDLQVTTAPRCQNLSVQIGSFAGNASGTDLSGQTKPALLGATVSLLATLNSSTATGTFTWSVAGNNQQELDSNNSVDNIRWMSEGTYRVIVTFTPSDGSCQASTYLDVNVVVPHVTNYTGRHDTEQINYGLNCSRIPGTTFSLGCFPNVRGILFDAAVEAPLDSISIPGESKVKFVQIVSQYRQRSTDELGTQCLTSRAVPSDTNTGWTLDGENGVGADPYDGRPGHLGVANFNDRYFAILATEDSPGNPLTVFTDSQGNPLPVPYQYQSLNVDDQFEMYVIYFVGDDPSNPDLTRAIGKLSWNWGGSVYLSVNGFSWNSIYNPTAGTISGVSISGPIRSYSGVVKTLESQWATCPSDTPPSCDPDGSQQRACSRRQGEWDPDSCSCYYTNP